MRVSIIPKRHYTRHKILGILTEKFIAEYNKERTNILKSENTEVSIGELCEKLGITEDYLRTCTVALNNSKDILYNSTGENGVEAIYLGENGLVDYFDNKWLLEGRKLNIDSFFDYFKVVSGVILLAIAVYTFINNVTTTIKNSSQIESLKSEMQSLSTEVHKSTRTP